MSATTVHLVRHGAHGHLDRVLSGRMPDVRLAELGRAQAESVARRLGGEAVAALFSSPLERTRETAEAIGRALNLPVQVSEAVNEIDCGEWTGATFETLRADERWHRWNRERAVAAPPGGEAMQAVQDRAWLQLAAWQLEYSDATIVVVSHSDVIKALVCRVLGLSLDRYHAFEVAPASVTTLVLWEEGGKLVSLGGSPVLDRTAA